MIKNLLFHKDLHLMISAVAVIGIGLSYGIVPQRILPLLFDFEVGTADLRNVFRAIMGLYLTISAFWIAGIIKPELWRIATLTNVLFMGGLAFGRTLSLILDGIPTTLFIIGLFLEVLFAAWGIVNLNRKGGIKVKEIEPFSAS